MKACFVSFFLEDPGPRFPAISDGYWLMVEGLGPGVHEIQIQATLPDPRPGNRPPLFDLDVTYFLTLGPQ